MNRTHTKPTVKLIPENEKYFREKAERQKKQQQEEEAKQQQSWDWFQEEGAGYWNWEYYVARDSKTSGSDDGDAYVSGAAASSSSRVEAIDLD